MKLLKEIFKRPVTICLLIIVIIFVGIVSTTNMAINLVPDITFPYLSIKTVYVGADANTIDKEITLKLEDSFSSISGVRNIQTYSIDNASIVLLQFEYGTKLESKTKEVEEKLSSIELPDGVTTPEISDIDLNSSSIFSLTIYDETKTMDELYQYALELETKFQAISGVEKTSLTGAPTKGVRIDMISGLEMFAPVVATEVATIQGYDIPLGDIKENSGSVSIDNSSSCKNLEDYQKLVITYDIGTTAVSQFSSMKTKIKTLETLKGKSLTDQEVYDAIYQYNLEGSLGMTPTVELIHFVRSSTFNGSIATFTLSDAASVYISSTYESKAYYNNQEAIQIDLYGASGSNATSIGKKAIKIINSYSEENDINVVMLNNQADFINDSLSNALVSLLIGMLLAVLVIYVFLRKIKSSLIIAVSMPLSVLASLGCLYAMGITLNMVSVGGLAVGIGMLVDNSIVVLESITSERSKGKTVLDASIDGVKLVLESLIGSTLTSVCVFFPILLIQGLTKEIFADLAWAVIFSLSFSLLVAVLVIPTLYCLFYKKEENSEENTKIKNKYFSKITNWYSNLLEKVLRRKGLTIIVSILIFALSLLLIFACDIEFLPSIDQGKITVTLPFEAGTTSDVCQDRTEQAYQIVQEEIEHIEYMSVSIGYTGLIQTSQSGVITIQLDSKAKDTSIVVEDIREAFEKKGFPYDYSVTEIDGVVATLVGSISGISVNITGEDVETLKEIASKIEADVLTKNGVKRASDNMLSTSTSYSLSFDQQKLADYGLDYKTVISTLRIGFAGYTVSEMNVDGQNLDVVVGWNDDVYDYYGSIDNIVIGVSTTGEYVKLSDCATITEEEGRHIIRKDNGLNVLTVSIEIYGIDTNTASKYLKASAEKVLKEYPNYTYSSSGVSSYLSDALEGLVIALVISFFLLFAVMACLFESLRKPCIIIFSFPFAFTGGFVALAITQVGINVVSLIGLIMLMGVIINDAIVLNERIDQLIEAGLPKDKAVIEGCRQRLRAVLMTTSTTVLALIPMALGIGKGSELMQPLGVVAIGGMTIGTMVTLILIPSVYSVFYKIKYSKDKPVYTGENYLEESEKEECTH